MVRVDAKGFPPSIPFDLRKKARGLSTLAEHESWMRQALDLAREAAAAGEVPVGALVVRQGRVLARARNEREGAHDPTAHAEIPALRRAGQALGGWQLTGCTVYVTLEPCPMCASALAQARPSLVVFGAFDEQMGGMGSVYALNLDERLHSAVPALGGVLAEDCRRELSAFFQARRENRPT